MQIDYGRLNALEAALGGRAAVNEAFVNRRRLAARVEGVSFAFDEPGLAAGVDLWTPTPGDLLLGAWIEIVAEWNGVTPQVGVAWDDPLAAVGFNWLSWLQGLPLNTPASPIALNNTNAFAGRITTTDPFRIAVSRDASFGGADPGATQGKATLYFILA